jgi:phosphoglucomutase
MHEIRDVATGGPARPLPHPSGDILIFHTEAAGCRFIARPSGTEPKIKFYLFARTEVGGETDLSAAKETTAHRLDRMAADIEQYLKETL